MTQDELKELIEIVAEKGFAEFEVERSGFRLRIVATHGTSIPNADPAVTPIAAAPIARVVADIAPTTVAPETVARVTAPAPVAVPAAADDAKVMRSPIVGTFYRAPNPNAEPFVKLGDRVEAGAIVCIVEAMKLMNEIEAEFGGEIVKVFVENGQPVEYGQPLFAIKP